VKFDKYYLPTGLFRSEEEAAEANSTAAGREKHSADGRNNSPRMTK